MKKIYLKDWKQEGDRVILIYNDGSELIVRYEDFNRAFGCILSAEKDAVKRDFAIADTVFRNNAIS